MSLKDKFRKKWNIKPFNIEPKQMEPAPMLTSFESQNTTIDPIVGAKGKTFSRLDELEKLISIQEEAIRRLAMQIQDLVLNGNPNAKYVLDTYDNQYKNVKDIQINYALSADKVRVPGTSNYVPMNEFIVAQAKNAETAGVTKTVQFNGGTYTMDQLLLNYVPSGLLKEAVQVDTYEEFREYINSKIK